MTREQEIAWAAGLFEGEGCFHVSTPRGSRSGRWPVPNAYLAMADFDPVMRFREIVGVGTLTERRFDGTRSHWRTQLMWRCSGADAAGVARLLVPLLGERRREAANEILETFATRQKSCPSCGRTYVASRCDQTACSSRCYDRVRRGRRPSPNEQLSLLYERGADLLPYEALYRRAS